MSFFSALSAIIGGIIVAVANHYFQTRREFIKFRLEKTENIIMRILDLITLCKQIQMQSIHIVSMDQANSFSEDIIKGDTRIKLEKIRIEMTALTRIYFKENYNDAVTCANFVDKFVIHIQDHSRKILYSLSEENRPYFSKDKPEHMETLQDIMTSGSKLEENIVKQTERDIKSISQILKQFLCHHFCGRGPSSCYDKPAI